MSTRETTSDSLRHDRSIGRQRSRWGFGRYRRNGETSGLHRRALLLRSLLVADISSLVAAFVASQALVGWSGGHALGATGTAVFAAALPVWLAIGTLLGLYDRDHERPDHTTVDDLGALFNMVTIGSWLFFAMLWSWIAGPRRRCR